MAAFREPHDCCGWDQGRHRGIRPRQQPEEGPVVGEYCVRSVLVEHRKRGDLSLDESFFPVLWHETGYRTPWLSELPEID